MFKVFLISFFSVFAFGVDASSLGLSENDFNFLNGLSGLLSSLLLVFLLLKRL